MQIATYVDVREHRTCAELVWFTYQYRHTNTLIIGCFGCKFGVYAQVLSWFQVVFISITIIYFLIELYSAHVYMYCCYVLCSAYIYFMAPS